MRVKVAVGFDEGTVVLKLGHEMPVASLDGHTGKVRLFGTDSFS